MFTLHLIEIQSRFPVHTRLLQPLFWRSCVVQRAYIQLAPHVYRTLSFYTHSHTHYATETERQRITTTVEQSIIIIDVFIG